MLVPKVFRAAAEDGRRLVPPEVSWWLELSLGGVALRAGPKVFFGKNFVPLQTACFFLSKGMKIGSSE